MAHSRGVSDVSRSLQKLGNSDGWLLKQCVPVPSRVAGGEAERGHSRGLTSAATLPVLGWPPLMEEGTAGWLEADSPEADSFPEKSGDSRYVPVAVNFSFCQELLFIVLWKPTEPLCSVWGRNENKINCENSDFNKEDVRCL